MTSHESDADDNSTVDRRAFLGTAATASVGLLAGCSGGGGNGGGGTTTQQEGGSTGGTTTTTTQQDTDGGGSLTKSEFTFTTGPSGSLAFQMANQLATRLKRASDLVMNVKAATSSQSVALLVTGQTDVAYATSIVGRRAVNKSGSFGKLEHKQNLMQVMSFYWIRVGLAAATGSDIKYYSDLPGNTIAPGPSGASYLAPFKIALDEAGVTYDDLDVVSSGPSQLAGILSSGDAAAAGGPLYINNLVPSFVQRIYSQNDVRMLGWKQGVIDKIKQNDKVSGFSVPNSELGKDIEKFTSSEQTFMPSANYVMYSSGGMPSQTIYTMLNTIWENLDQLSKAHPGFKPWKQKEFWMSNMIPAIPVHPGAAKFYKEKGIWSEEFTVAGE